MKKILGVLFVMFGVIHVSHIALAKGIEFTDPTALHVVSRDARPNVDLGYQAEYAQRKAEYSQKLNQENGPLQKVDQSMQKPQIVIDDVVTRNTDVQNSNDVYSIKLLQDSPSVIKQTEIVNSFSESLQEVKTPEEAAQVLAKVSTKLEEEGLPSLSKAQQNELITTELPKNFNRQSASWILEFINKILEMLTKSLKNEKLKDGTISLKAESDVWLDNATSQLTKEQLQAPETAVILKEFSKLPAKARPAEADISKTLIRMDRGENIQNAIISGDVAQIKSMVASAQLDPASQDLLVNLLVGKDSKGVIAADKIGVQLSKTDPAQFKQVRDAYLNILVDVQWSLFKKSMVKEEGFASGAITVIDPQEKLMTALENYVKFVNPKFDAPGLSLSAITSGEAYSRSGNGSSHWKGQIDSNRIYGINVKFDGKYTEALPQNKD